MIPDNANKLVRLTRSGRVFRRLWTESPWCWYDIASPGILYRPDQLRALTEAEGFTVAGIETIPGEVDTDQWHLITRKQRDRLIREQDFERISVSSNRHTGVIETQWGSSGIVLLRDIKHVDGYRPISHYRLATSSTRASLCEASSTQKE